MMNSGHLNGVISTADDVEKGEVFETGQREDLGVEEPLLTPLESQDSELAANSRKLILKEKLGVGLVIVIILIMEAYFVGRSLRHSEDYHNDRKFTNNTGFGPSNSPLEVLIENGGRVQESAAVATPEPFEDFVGVNSKPFTMTNGFMSTVTEMPPKSRPVVVVVREVKEVAISTADNFGVKGF